MNDFTASNGVTLGHSPEGHILLPKSVMGLGEDTQQALREFFQAEADERLGRWRWPENPGYVVYPKGDGLFEVLHEGTGLVLTSTVSGNAPFADEHAQAARAYLATHPEPKPWDEAKDGEIWALTGAGGLEQPWRRLDGKWVSCTPSLRTYDATLATAGRLIWSEVAS